MTYPGDCRHFTGIQHRTCKAGVVYARVRGTDGREPCLPSNAYCSADAVCTAFEPLSELEAKAIGAALDEAVNDALQGLCPQCGRTLKERRSESVTVSICLEHGVVMRQCRRVGEP